MDSFSSTLLTPLHLACQEGHVDCVLLLLTRDANVNLAGEDGLTALHIACFLPSNGHNQDSTRGWLPLHVAVSKDFKMVVKLMIQSGAVVDATTHSGDTALLVACKAGSVSCVETLLLHHADITATDAHGKQPIDYSNEEISRLLNEYVCYILTLQNE